MLHKNWNSYPTVTDIKSNIVDYIIPGPNKEVDKMVTTKIKV